MMDGGDALRLTAARVRLSSVGLSPSSARGAAPAAAPAPRQDLDDEMAFIMLRYLVEVRCGGPAGGGHRRRIASSRENRQSRENRHIEGGCASKVAASRCVSGAARPEERRLSQASLSQPRGAGSPRVQCASASAVQSVAGDPVPAHPKACRKGSCSLGLTLRSPDSLRVRDDDDDAFGRRALTRPTVPSSRGRASSVVALTLARSSLEVGHCEVKGIIATLAPAFDRARLCRGARARDPRCLPLSAVTPPVVFGGCRRA